MAKPKKKRQLNAWLITVLSLLFAVTVGVLAWTQLASYEEGVMEVYARQQDGYVQLVLDQINLNKARSDDEIINDILGTLDASTNKYWTLAQQDTLMFVKDVMETNRYKGFTTTTYFVSDSAREFISSLQTDRVIHRTIQMGERRFVASGVQFTYRGEAFRLCLLTSADLVLDQNAYLSAKINVCVLALILLCTFILVSITLAGLCQKWRQRYDREAKETLSLRKTVEYLNNELSGRALYDTRQTAFMPGALPTLLEKLEERHAFPVYFILLHCDSPQARDRFLMDSQITLDRHVLRVLPAEDQILLITLRSQAMADQAALTAFRSPGLHSMGTLEVPHSPGRSLNRIYNEFYENRVNTYGTQAVS